MTSFRFHDGDDAYGDFEIVQNGQSWVASNRRSYEPGLAMVDPWTGSGGTNTKYYHSDHLGTTRTMSAASGFDGGRRVFTAFGEPVSTPTPPDRYGYVGAHGYQTHPDLPFLHLGARYYDASSGRFLQRDPIGLRGGKNVYEYVRSSASMHVDPQGLAFQWAGWGSAGPIVGCGMLLVQLTERIIKPWIDEKIEENYLEESQEINDIPPPTLPPPRDRPKTETDRQLDQLRGLPHVG